MGYGAEGMKYRFQWNFPIIFSRHNPKRLYTFSNHVHVSENEGQSWKLISEDLTRNDSARLVSSGGPITQDNTGVEYYCTIFAANESPLKEGLLWVGSDDGLIHVTRDGGETWENVTPSGMPEWMMINSVEPSYFDEGTCYVAGTRYKLGDFTPYLYKTTDYGKTWSKITAGIDKEHFTRVVRQDPSQKGLLYAGTETGMYISFNDGRSWEPFQLNLPVVPITDLAIKDNNLIVATQGRSLWMIDDLTVLHQLEDASKAKSNFLFKPRDSYRTKGSKGKESKLNGTNRDNGVMTYFNVPDYDKEKDSVYLSYFTPGGDTLASFFNKAKKKEEKLKLEKGPNTFTWNMRTQGAEKLQGMILWWANLNGAKVVPGIYKVVLHVNGEDMEQTFNVLADPRSEASPEEMQRQYAFVSEVNQTVDRAHQSIKKIRKINDQLDAFIKQYKDNEEVADLVQKARDLKKSFSDIEKALYQTQNRSNQDPLNFPIRLTNKLGHLNSLVTLDDFAPTEQDVQLKEELTAEINKELEAFDKLVTEEVEKFNNSFNESRLNYLLVE
jgi:hypothetical protein